MPPSPQALASHLVRHTRRFEAMLHFYRDSLGLTVTEEWSDPGNRGAILAPGPGTALLRVELLDMDDVEVSEAAPANIALSIEIEDVDGYHAQLIAAGLRIARQLEDAPWGHRSFGIDDPDGLRIWFYQDLND